MPLALDSFPMHLFRASQERGWVASAIDFSNERAHWASLADDERELFSRLIAGFRVGERGVTHELAPLQHVLREEKRLDEELYVTAQLFEEARHVEFFERWLDAALPGVWGKDIPYPELTGDLFSARLPEIMRALLTDASPRAQVRAIVTYHFNIEGIGAESAYPIYYEVFDKTGLFPAMREGITLIRRDEARHIAFGTYLLNRLINETRGGRRRVRGRARGARAVHRGGRQPDLRSLRRQSRRRSGWIRRSSGLSTARTSS